MRIGRGTWFVAGMLVVSFPGAGVRAETGMGLVVDRVGKVAHRIDLQNNQIIFTSPPIGTKVKHGRFSPDGNRLGYVDENGKVFACDLDGNLQYSFQAFSTGTLSWTDSGIWIGGEGKAKLYDPATGDVLGEVTPTGVPDPFKIKFRVVSHSETSYSALDHPPPIAKAVLLDQGNQVQDLGSGCSVGPSPDGSMFTHNLWEDGMEHQTMWIQDRAGKVLHYFYLFDLIPYPANETDGWTWNSQSWSSNSQDIILIPAGRGFPQMDYSTVPWIYNLSTGEAHCLHSDPYVWDVFWYITDFYDGRVGPSCQDNDGDGYGVGSGCAGPDCDDGDDSVHPGASEACNGVDDDCDGSVPSNEKDSDSDGYRRCQGDCDDGDDSVHPGASEACNGVDDDCDGSVPSNEKDSDSDGYRRCQGDCDDGDDSVHPGASEACNGVDDDCDGSVPSNEKDSDSDGYRRCQGDCDDQDDSVHPGASEACNGVDDDCDGSVPSNEKDSDSDGYRRCQGDCDDQDDSVHPGASEACNGVDDDCSGSVPANEADADGDGHRICDGDCDDQDDSVHPGASEACNGVDDDCDSSTDEGCECTDGEQRSCGTNEGECVEGTQTCAGGTWGSCEGEVGPVQEACNGSDDDCDGSVPADEADADGDGHRVCENDCDDANADVHPGAIETCNGLDDDCDGATDVGCPCTEGQEQSCGTDEGECVQGTQRCAGGAWGTCEGGVDPTNEVCGDDLDNDCDGQTDEDCTTDGGGLDAGDGELVIIGSCGCGRGSPANLIALAFVLGWFTRARRRQPS